MNLFQLVIKQMRQRALSTWLTLLSVLLGVGLATAILILYREGNRLFGQSDFGYDLIIGPRGSRLQLVLNTSYHLSTSPGLIPYSYYESFPMLDALEWAIPYAVGDEFQGHRIIGTLPKLFRGFPEQVKELSELAAAQRQINGGEGGLIPQKSVIERLGKVHEQLEVDAPDAAGRIDEAVELLTKAAADSDHTRRADQQKKALDAIIAAKVLATGPGEYRRGRNYELQEGRIFDPRKFEAVIGSDVARKTGLKVGSTFKGQHGSGVEGPKEEHAEKWTVVGILKPTRTANDRVIFIPLVSFYAVAEHEAGLKDIAKVMGTESAAHDEHDEADGHERGAATRPADDHDHGATTAPADAHAGHEHRHRVRADGTIALEVPKRQWTLAAVLAKSSGGRGTEAEWFVNHGTTALAVNPATEMLEFFNTFLQRFTLVFLLISVLVTVVAAVSILVSIYNSVSARLKEIAILRALGATRNRVLTLICLEAGLVGLFGGLGGLIIGHALGAGGSLFLNALLGEGIAWYHFDYRELAYLAGVICMAVLAGLVPAAKAYETPVATHLAAT